MYITDTLYYQGEQKRIVVRYADIVNGTKESSETPIQGENEIGITINIEEFNNYTNEDIDALADKILIAIQNKIIRRKAAFQ